MHDIVMDLQKQLDLLHQLFQGTFDTNRQCQLEKELKKADDGFKSEHDWVWSTFFAVDTPNFGTHVLLARQGFRATGQIYRQRLYRFLINTQRNCVENQIYKLKDESLFEKAQEDPSVVANLDPNKDAECMEGCSVFWEYLPQQNRFHGSTMEGTCRFASKFFPGKTIIATSDVFIDAEELWTLDRGVDTDGNKMYGFKNDDHHKMVRTTTYKGIVKFKGHAQELSLHNQGGNADVVVANSKFSVKLEQAVEVDTTVKVLRLSLQSNEEPVGSAVSDPNAALIGMTLQGIEILLQKS